MSVTLPVTLTSALKTDKPLFVRFPFTVRDLPEIEVSAAPVKVVTAASEIVLVAGTVTLPVTFIVFAAI